MTQLSLRFPSGILLEEIQRANGGLIFDNFRGHIQLPQRERVREKIALVRNFIQTFPSWKRVARLFSTMMKNSRVDLHVPIKL